MHCFEQIIKGFSYSISQQPEKHKYYFYTEILAKLNKKESINSCCDLLTEIFTYEGYLPYNSSAVYGIPTTIIGILYDLKYVMLAKPMPILEYESEIEKWLKLLKQVFFKANFNVAPAHIDKLLAFATNAISSVEIDGCFNLLTHLLSCNNIDIKQSDYLRVLSTTLTHIDYNVCALDKPFEYFIEVFKQVNTYYHIFSKSNEMVIGLDKIWSYFIYGRTQLSIIAKNALINFYQVFNNVTAVEFEKQMSNFCNMALIHLNSKKHMSKVLGLLQNQIEFYHAHHKDISKDEFKLTVLIPDHGTYSFTAQPSMPILKFMNKICNIVIRPRIPINQVHKPVRSAQRQSGVGYRLLA